MDDAQGRIGGPTCVSLVLRGPQYQRYAKPKIVQHETDVCYWVQQLLRLFREQVDYLTSVARSVEYSKCVRRGLLDAARSATLRSTKCCALRSAMNFSLNY